MRPKLQSPGQKLRTFIDEARRTQLVESTIEILAEQGFARTSLAEIARHAGVSKGVISYHFKGKDELIQEVVVQVYRESETWLGEIADLDAPAGEKLRRYMADTFAFLKTDRKRFKAFMEIFLNYRKPDGNLYYDDSVDESTLQFVETVLREGQAKGEFRAFDPHIMAICLRSMVDAAAVRLIAEPSLDLDVFSAELAAIFERAIRADARKAPDGGSR